MQARFLTAERGSEDEARRRGWTPWHVARVAGPTTRTPGELDLVRLGYWFGGRVQRGVLGVHMGQRGGAVGGRDVGGEDLDGHRAGDAVQVDEVGPGQVAACAVGRGPHSRPAVAVNGPREVADPLREPVVVAERLPPLIGRIRCGVTF